MTEPQNYQIYRVKPDDTLTGIAKRFCGSAHMYLLLFELNRDVFELWSEGYAPRFEPNPNYLWPGMKLRVPAKPKEKKDG